MALRRRFPLTQDDDSEPYQPGGTPTPVTPQPAPTFHAPQTPLPTDLKTQPVPTTPAPTTPKAPLNTDGYAAPSFLPKASGGAMSGWDQTKWANESHMTPKYGVGRILSNYAPTVEGLGQAITEIQRAYPGSTFNGKDKITIPGVGTFDVLQGASQGGSAWQWMDLP